MTDSCSRCLLGVWTVCVVCVVVCALHSIIVVGILEQDRHTEHRERNREERDSQEPSAHYTAHLC